MGKSDNQPSEDALTYASLKERFWVSCDISMDSLWNPPRSQRMITEVKEDRLKNFWVEEEQVARLVDILQADGKLGEFYELLKKNPQKLTPLSDSHEEQHSVSEVVEGQSQIDTAVAAIQGKVIVVVGAPSIKDHDESSKSEASNGLNTDLTSEKALTSLRYDQCAIDEELKAFLLSKMKERDQAIAKAQSGQAVPSSSLPTPTSPDELQSSSAPSPSDQVASPEVDTSYKLRYIIIDGSNVAMSHGIEKEFSCKGIQICVNYFHERGHKNITAIVPQSFTCKAPQKHPISDQHILNELIDQGFLVYTPAKRVDGEHDNDTHILELAMQTGGIVVSNDNYRDLQNKQKEWGEIIRNRVTGFCFVDDIFMLPLDPIGRNGPHLNELLQKSPLEDVTGSSSTPGVTRDQELQAGPASANEEPHNEWQQVPRRHKKRANQRPGASNKNSGGDGKNRVKGAYSRLNKPIVRATLKGMNEGL